MANAQPPMNINPLISPSTYADQLQLTRQQQIAQMLMQQGQDVPQGQMVSGHYIAPSWSQHLSRLANTLGAGYMNSQNDQKQADISSRYSSDLARMLNGDDSGGYIEKQQPTPPGLSDSSAGAFGMSPQEAAPYNQAPQQAPIPANNFRMANLLRGQAIGSLGGDQASAAYWKQAAPELTEIQKLMQAQGISPNSPQGRQMLQAATEKSNLIAPIVNRGFGIGTMQNGKYVPDPASLQQALDLKRGEQGIELPYRSPVSMDTSSGQKAQVFPSEFPTIQQGIAPQRFGQPTQQAIPQGTPSPASYPKVSPQEQAARDSDRLRILQQELAANPNDQALKSELARMQSSPQGVGTVGLSQTQSDQINQERQRAGGKSVDEAFAKDYVEFTAKGGGADAAKQLGQLKDVVGALGAPKPNLTGPMIGSLPDAVLKVTNPNSIAMRERVEEVVQRSLRAILGAQFTEKEGERLIARAYNPNLKESENAVRVDRLYTQLTQAFQAKQDAAKYFEKNGTLQGWTGKLYSVSDFDPTPQQSNGKIDVRAQADAILGRK